MTDATENLSTCGCCEANSEVPEHDNRPGQPARFVGIARTREA